MCFYFEGVTFQTHLSVSHSDHIPSISTQQTRSSLAVSRQREGVTQHLWTLASGEPLHGGEEDDTFILSSRSGTALTVWFADPSRRFTNCQSSPSQDGEGKETFRWHQTYLDRYAAQGELWQAVCDRLSLALTFIKASSSSSTLTLHVNVIWALMTYFTSVMYFGAKMDEHIIQVIIMKNNNEINQMIQMIV